MKGDTRSLDYSSYVVRDWGSGHFAQGLLILDSSDVSGVLTSEFRMA